MSRQNFLLAAVVGAIVIFLLSFLPVIGPLIGGLVAGLVARGKIRNGAMAGVAAGLIGAALVALVFLLGPAPMTGIFQHALVGVLRSFGVAVILLVIGVLYALLGLVGGAIGAAIVKG